MLRGGLVALVMAGWVAGALAAQSKADSAKMGRSRADSTKARATGTDSTKGPLAGRVRGSGSAPVTVYEMSDFQCPYCREFAVNTFPAIDSTYVATGRVRWAFVNFPLTSIHHNAVAAAEVALCAAQQGGFWRVHDLLYQHQDVWAPLKEPAAFFLTLADSAKLSKPALLACLRSPSTEEAIRADAQGAERSGATSTPTFYIEGGLLVGAQPLPVFRQVLDSILKGKERGKKGR
jgi:protein-disulfide isomerase